MQVQNKELILLVDDDPGNLKRAQTILGEEFRISATTSGKMALSLLSKVTPDLILLDVNMPEMNGFETLKKIRERGIPYHRECGCVQRLWSYQPEGLLDQGHQLFCQGTRS